jgi:PKD repeat protein
MSEFVATFNLYLGDHDGSDGAAFVFCPTYDYPSSNGSWLDASCPNGYLVAFDTYEFGAPSRVYVAFQNTNNRLASVDLATPLDNGNWHTVAVNLHETITVTLDGHNVITGAAFPSYVPFGGYFGFSAGTGLGTNEQRVDDIHVYARTDGVSPTAAFTSTYIIVLTGDTVTLTNLTTGTPFLSYIWNFGDGSPLDYDINPSHTYNTIGDFIVALTATNPFGESVVTGTVSSGALAVAAFTPTVSIIHVRETATFTNLSTGFPLPTYTWDWGDGSPLSSAVSPTHPYNTIGNFTVTLTATNRYNQNVATGVVTVIPYKIYLPMVIRD